METHGLEHPGFQLFQNLKDFFSNLEMLEFFKSKYKNSPSPLRNSIDNSPLDIVIKIVKALKH